ncbi:MAG: tyrosine-protein phosphatase [Gemmatimonadaceae bacterium]
MIDIHSHLLPAVDDGSPTVEVSVEVLERFSRDGVELVVCTPHLNASDAHEVGVDCNEDLLENLRRHAPLRPQLASGWEIMLDKPGVDLRPLHLHLAGSTAVLVEFPRTQVPDGAAKELYRLRMCGVVPVLAHPERYWGCTSGLVRSWREAGAVIQMDAAMVLGSEPASRLSKTLLQEGLVDCIASDNHGDVRSLAAARTWLLEIGATEQANMLTSVNARRLLADEPVLPVSPIPVIEKGAVARLKELLLGRR